MNKGEYQGAYFHPKFIENRKDLLVYVRRVSTKNNNSRQVNSSPLITEADGINSLTNLLNSDFDDGSNLDIGMDDFDNHDSSANAQKKAKLSHDPYGNNDDYNRNPNTIPSVIPKNIPNHVPNVLAQSNGYASSGLNNSVPQPISASTAQPQSKSTSPANNAYQVPTSKGYEQTLASDIYTTNSGASSTYKGTGHVIPLPQHPMVMTHNLSPGKFNEAEGIATSNNQDSGVPLLPPLLQPSPSRSMAPLSMPYLFRGISVNTQDELRNLLASNSFATSNPNSLTNSTGNEPRVSGFGTNIGKPPPSLNRYQSDLLLSTDIEKPCISDSMINNIEFDKAASSPIRTPGGVEITSTPGKPVRQSSNLDLLSAVAFHRSTSKDGSTPTKSDLNLDDDLSQAAPVSLKVTDEPLSLHANTSSSMAVTVADDDIWRQDARK